MDMNVLTYNSTSNLKSLYINELDQFLDLMHFKLIPLVILSAFKGVFVILGHLS